MRAPEEYERTLGGPLPIKRLVQIWQELPERDRLGFVHSLDEQIADMLMAATMPATITQQWAGATAPNDAR